MTLAIKYPTEIAFACASYAARVNGGYLKVAEFEPFDHKTGTGGKLVKQTNKQVLLDALNNQSVLTQADHHHAAIVRNFCQGLIIRQLAHGNLSEFHQKMMEYANEDECRVANAGIVAYAPIFANQQLKRQAITEKLDGAKKGYISTPGQKVELDIEVIRSNYSQQYGCYFITAITEEGVVFFSFKRELEVNKKYSIEGKVKAHKPGGETQLNYVKI
jgi:hypothetical protein